MAIDFNKQLVFDPKIDIVGNEVPLSAMEKTGAVLQDRYDKSYEQYSMADEALKQMEASANAVDREKAKELRNIYNQEMQGILQKGDFHNMRQQTASLARNAAINYKTIAEKNAKIQAELDAIAKNPKYILDPEGAAQDYLKNLKPISINPETKTISDFNVGTYNAPADVDEMKWAITYGAVMKPTIDKVKGTSIVSVDKFGKETNDPNQAAMLMTKTKSGSLVELKTEDLQKALLPAAYADPNIQARLNRDVKRAGYDPNTKEGKFYKEELFNKQTLPAISAAAGLLRRDEDMGAETVAFHNIPGGDGSGNGDPLKTNTYTPNDVFQDYKTQARLEFPDLLNSTLQNNKKSKASLLSALDNMAQNGNAKAVEAKKVVKGLTELAEKYPEYADILRRSTGGKSNTIVGRIGQSILDVGSHINNLINTGAKRSDDVILKGTELVDKYKELARTGIFDSKFEDEFEAATQTAPFTRKLPINAVNLESDVVRTAVSKLSNDLNINKFDILEGEWQNPEDLKLTITGVSREPYGAGSGIAFELMDSKGNTVIATPKKQAAEGIIGELNKVLPGIKSANNYKDMIPLSYAGQQKDFADIGDEINNPQLTKQYKGYKLVLNEDGTYTRISPKGEKVNATNPTLLLPQM
jgi:hypothetical protein